MRAFIISLAALLLLASCSERNASDFSLVEDEVPPGVTRLYIDAFGSLYPASGLKTDFAFSPRHHGSLLNAMLDETSGLCADVPTPSQAQILCSALPERNWSLAQIELWTIRAKEILRDSKVQEGPVDLVFLIHGFNTLAKEARPEYKAARELISDKLPQGRQAHFVEIYWDGFRQDIFPEDAWANAQSGGPLVGLQLRRLMHAIRTNIDAMDNPDVRIRYLTHSSGAFVVGATFGDPIAALPDLQNPSDGNPEVETDYEFFARVRADTDPSFQNSVSSFDDLKIGMLAPATSDWTFVGNSEFDAGFLSQNAIVLFSIHPADQVLNKFGIGADFANTGSTGLGVDSAKHYCNHLRGNRKLAERGVRFLGYDFSRSASDFPGEVRSHSFGVYLNQAANHSEFLADLFGKGEIDFAAGEARVCG